MPLVDNSSPGSSPTKGRKNDSGSKLQPVTGLLRCSRLVWFLILLVVFIGGANFLFYWQQDGEVQTELVKIAPARVAGGVNIFSKLAGSQTSNPTQVVTHRAVTSQQPNLTTSQATPKTSMSVDFNNPTDAAHSFFTVKQIDASLHYTLCDKLELHIEVRDRHNKLKTYGGDYFWVKIFSNDLDASQAADTITDHQNGTYTAEFVLHWTGNVHMKVVLIKSSEYVALLRHHREIGPARFAYDGMFILGNQKELMPCHITKDMYLGSLESQRSRGFCDFSDRALGYPWFCLKPKTLPCSAWAQHMGVLPRGHQYSSVLAKQENASVQHRFANIRQTGAIAIQVVSIGNTSEMSTCTAPLQPCTQGIAPRPPSSVAGFYFRKEWHSLTCQLKPFVTEAALNCLRDHRLYFFGDSTIRQWFEYLSVRLGQSMQEKHMQTSQHCGPRFAEDKSSNLTIFYRHHGYPIRATWTNVQDIKYTAHEIDGLQAGPNTAVFLTFWAHFTPTTIEFYLERWKAVKEAIRRLRKRDPNTPVFIKSANTREQQGMDMSNWYAMELDKVMREDLINEPGVTIIDVWDMTLSHSSGYRIHPVEAIISQEIKVALNFLCPMTVA
ncbi:NXPE family member 3-like isoform X1 [Asterias rubens]|uniref:NXPE family member 3-like isoform X1 n=1 Tax=Asterias rubens TaxID=7604 RepID=UPI001454F2C7|nr:NXPE family member 3-like isoform X1 [Asterias rubens]